MDKKKGVIIAVVLLLLLMVGTFAFQRDDEQKYDGEPDSGIQDDNNDNDPDTDSTTPAEEEENTDDELEGTQTVNGNGVQNGNLVNNQNGQGNNANQGGNNNGNIPTFELSTEKLEASVESGNDVLTTTNSIDTTLNELLSQLEIAVSEGEEIISNPTTQTAIDEKQQEIDNLLDQIEDYLNDAYAKAEAAVELSEKENTKENLDNATELVNLLPDGDRKDELLERIKDTTAPTITLNGDSSMTLEAGVDAYEELGATVTDNVDETVTDLQPILINYSVGGVFNGTVKNVDTTKVGTYKIVYKYTDQAGNVAVDANRADHDYVMRIVNVVDTIAPEYETLRLLRIEPDYSTFAKNGDKIRVLVDFKEELATLPKLKINNEVEVNFRLSGYREDTNTYLYMADYTIPADESELAEGELSILVYGYGDSSNNTGEDLDNSKINHDTQNKVIYDRTLPTYNFTNGNTFREKEVVVTDTYFDYMTIYNYATKETTTTTENTWMMTSGNTMYKLTAYDKAGNYKEIWIYHDDSVAAFEGTGKIGGEDTEFTDGGIYQSLSLRVSDNDLISVVQELNGEKTTLASYTWENNPEYVDFEFTEEGTYKVIATDRAGNTSYVIFTIDTTPADAIHEAVNILEVGEPNEQSEYYVTTGDTVQVYARFDEVLAGNPTFTLINNNQEYVIPTEDVIVTGPNDEGKYTYKINYEVKADEMDEGEITLKISNIYDKAGNKTEDITKPTNGHRVYIDRVNPEILSLTQEYEDKQDGRIKVTIVTSEEIFGDEVHSTAWRKVGENTYVNYFYRTKEVTINFTDIAGNSGNYRFTVDKTAPEILSLTQEYEDKQDGRIKVTIVTSEEIFGDEVHSTAWRKVGENTYVNYFYRTKEVTINFTDAVGNPATYTFTVDKTAPVYGAMGIFNWTNDKNNEDLTYATKDEHIRLYVAFPEMLGTNPKVDIYGQDGTVTTLDMAYSEAAKFYFVEFDTTDELNLPQGKINYRIYGYKDETGNVGVDLTQDNTTSKEYPYVIYDSVAPSFNVANTTHDDKAMEIVVTDDNFDYAVIINQDTGEKKTVSDKVFTVSDEATYHIYAYDKSENVAELWVAIDKQKPFVRVSGTGENNKFKSDVLVDISDKFLTEVKINDTIYTRDDFSFDNHNEDGKFSIPLTEEKEYTVIAKDKFGHDTKVEFSIDKTNPVVTLTGGDMNVEINTEFVDPGYTVTDNMDKDLEVNIVVYYSKTGASDTWTGAPDNKVDTSVLGYYAIWYSATDSSGNVSNSVRRIIVVQDTTNPEIILPEDVIGLNKNEKHIEAGSVLSLEGLVQAKDNFDKNVKLELKHVTFYAASGLKEDNIYNYDFTNGIDTRKVGRYNLDYVATDASGNEAKKTLLIMISDTTKPVISIDRTVELNVGDEFVEDIDSKISDNSDDTLKVEIYPVNGKEVDTTQAGTYQINYKISDTSGNIEVATRTVIVK